MTTISRLVWSPAEDALMLRTVEQLGPKWIQIAALLPNRSDGAVRNRWHRLSEAKRTTGAAVATAAAAPAAPAAPAEWSSALEAPTAIDRSSVYECSRCGQPKKSHACTAPKAIGGDDRGSGLPLAADVLLCAKANSLTMPVAKKPKRDECTAGPSSEHEQDTHDARAAMLQLQEWPYQGGHQWPYQAQEQQFHAATAYGAFKQGIGGMRSTSPEAFVHDNEQTRKELTGAIRESDSPATYIRFLGVAEAAYSLTSEGTGGTSWSEASPPRCTTPSFVLGGL